MTPAEKMGAALNRLAKWRSVLAGWQLGTRSAEDPESQAVRDHREATMVLRVEVTAITGLLLRKGLIEQDELLEAVAEEAGHLERAYEQRFPGFQASEHGMVLDPVVAQETMKGWRP